MTDEPPVQVWNEYARVRLEVEAAGRARRLRITDTATGRSIALDSLELEGLTRMTHERLAALLGEGSLEDTPRPGPAPGVGGSGDVGEGVSGEGSV